MWIGSGSKTEGRTSTVTTLANKRSLDTSLLCLLQGRDRLSTELTGEISQGSTKLQGLDYQIPGLSEILHAPAHKLLVQKLQGLGSKAGLLYLFILGSRKGELQQLQPCS